MKVTMQQIELIGNSFELFNLINEHRVMAGKKPMKYHRDLVVKIKREAIKITEAIYLERVNNLELVVKDKVYTLNPHEVKRMLIREGIQVEGYQVCGVRDRKEFAFERLLKSAFPTEDITEQLNVQGSRLDFYFPAYNLAVECDEKYHKSQPAQDRSREVKVKDVLGCKIIRVAENEEGKGIVDIFQFITSH